MLCSHTVRAAPRKKISRARLNRERHSVPSLGGLPAKTQHARCKQRHADDPDELRLVAMPTDFGAGRYSLISAWRRASADRSNIAAILFAGKGETTETEKPQRQHNGRSHSGIGSSPLGEWLDTHESRTA